ncbi:MAG: hypothetical protein U5J64_05940 [Halobacteriales archaeon]|nr:hypothetical protein [Halobacteriales archaeon]
MMSSAFSEHLVDVYLVAAHRQSAFACVVARLDTLPLRLLGRNEKPSSSVGVRSSRSLSGMCPSEKKAASSLFVAQKLQRVPRTRRQRSL